ncbi:MAG: hypothetical protein Q7T53_11305 [Deltaproteobacteria bacterium]|nr:hypothetical protein [Deltaproteobacteria bacterium]
MGLWTDAKDMLAAAKILHEKEKQRIGNPIYYLLCHGVEEAFKAFICAKGGSLKCLKSIGHDLELAKEWAVACGLDKDYQISKEHDTMLKLINGYYKSKEFEYRVTGYKRYPKSENLITFLEDLLKHIRNTCLQSVK